VTHSLSVIWATSPTRPTELVTEMQRNRNPVLNEIEPEIIQMLETFGYELVLDELKGPAGAKTLTLYIDKPGGVDSDECAEMAKKVAMVLETIDAQRHNYSIIVSSPGIERPLTNEKDFQRFSGENATLIVQQAQGKQTLTGVLRGLNKGCVVIERGADTVEVPVADLVGAHLAPDWQGT